MASVDSVPQLVKFWEIVPSFSFPWASSKSNFSIVCSAVCTTNGTLALKYMFKHCSFSLYFMQFFPLCKRNICLLKILWYIGGGICSEMILGIGALSDAYVFGTCSILYDEFWIPGFLWCLNCALYVSYYEVFHGFWGFGEGFFVYVYDRNFSLGNMRLSSFRGHLYLKPVMETERVLSK